MVSEYIAIGRVAQDCLNISSKSNALFASQRILEMLGFSDHIHSLSTRSFWMSNGQIVVKPESSFLYNTPISLINSKDTNCERLFVTYPEIPSDKRLKNKTPCITQTRIESPLLVLS